tara:strand:- start:110 stop:217 length:108 start_codon:yes stop_codon:yes gene_type:complete
MKLKTKIEKIEEAAYWVMSSIIAIGLLTIILIIIA